MITPQNSLPNLANQIGVPELYFKREDLHPYGSHKGRSIPKMIDFYTKQGFRDFTISSSGNAALAAIHEIQKLNEQEATHSLVVFVGQKIDKEKLKILQDAIKSPKIEIKQVERPKQTAFQLDKQGVAKNLRQSNDDIALLGYKSLAEELDEIDNLENVFIPTSSGTTAEALGTYFKEFNKNVEIHIAQTESCNPIASEFMEWNKINVENSIAGAIVDNVAHRKDRVVEIIKQSGGSGWIITNSEIKNAIKLVKEKTDIEISPNSALSVAALIKAREAGWSFNGATVCLITGK